MNEVGLAWANAKCLKVEFDVAQIMDNMSREVIREEYFRNYKPI